MGMLITIALIGFLGVATVTDLRDRKIYNWVTYPGILIALGLNSLGSLLMGWQISDATILASWGMIGLGASLAGFLLCGFILLVCYGLFRVGGGDVKLIAMIGAFLGPERGLEVMLWTFVFGGCLGLIVLVWQVGPGKLAAAAFRHLLWTLRLGYPQGLTPAERSQLQPSLHLAPSALAAALVVQFSLLE